MKRCIPLQNHWKFFDPRSKQWLSAQVPGCIHTDLLKHGLISDPFWGSNEHELQWISDREWIYQCEFQADTDLLVQSHIELVAEGLDTLATIELNGRQIAKTESMFVAFRFEIKQFLKPGSNTLEIRFSSPMEYIRERRRPSDHREWVDPVGGCHHIRKEQCSFGWDWGPRLVSCGIYKPIRLEAWNDNRIDFVTIRQQHSENGVELSIKTKLADKDASVVHGTLLFDGDVIARFKNSRCTISQPKLWWPNGHGEQPLYDLKLELVKDGCVLDVQTRRIGLRTIELDRHDDQYGESFQFVVNGRPLFAKGANWIPAHTFVTEVHQAIYNDLLSSAVDANMNMIRVWGGGIYEMDEFYNICDEKGLLVWQDFMFACALYPGTPDFLALVRAEAECQVKRLASHACLALWCGNNEIEQMPMEIAKTRRRRKAYADVFYGILPRAVSRFDGVTPYWPSSPHNPDGYENGHNNEHAGDSHFWEVWHARKPVKTYEEKKFRFCSEFGMQSYCSPEVAATFCDPERFNVFSPAMENHQKNPVGNLIIFDYISRLYRFPKDYTALAYLSQLNQAYCMRIGVEHFRRSMPCTMGALYWQLNDCWPVASWSSIEYGGHWKALHYAAKRFFAPALVTAHVLGDEIIGICNRPASTIHDVNIHTVYDGDGERRADLKWTLYHLDNRKLRGGRKEVILIYGESVRQLQLDFANEIARYGAANLVLRVWIETKQEVLSETTVLFTAPRFMDLASIGVKTFVREVSLNLFEIEFSAEAFLHQVYFDLPKVSFHATDNFFDLFPGIPHFVKVATILPLSEFRKRLKTMSLVNTY